MEESIVVHDENHEPMMVNEADMDFRVPRLPHSVVKHAQSTSVRQFFRKLRTTQIEMLFNKIYDRINHLILSVQSQNKWFGMLGTSNYVNYSRRNPKRSAKVCFSYWNIGIVHCTCGHFLRKRRGANQQFIKKTMDLLSIPEYVIKKRRPHGHRYGKKPTGNTFRPTSWRRNARKSSSKEFMTDSYAMKHSVMEWLKMVETKMFVDNGMLLQMKIIPTIWPHKNITITKVIGGFIQTRQVPILCQWSTDLTSNKHCLPSSNWNKKKELYKRPRTFAEINRRTQSSSSSSWWSWQGSWWTPYSYESHDGDEPSTDRTGWPVVQSIWNNSSGRDFLEFIYFVTDGSFYSWRRSTVTTGCVNTTPQMACFCGAKVCTKWLQEKATIKAYRPTTSWNWEQVASLIWDQDENGTKSGKLRIGHECVVTMHDADTNDNMFTIVHDCVVTLHDAYTNDNMTTSTGFHNVWAWARTV